MESETGPESGEPLNSTEPGTPFAPIEPTPPLVSAPPPQPSPAEGWPGYGQAQAGPYGYPPYGYDGPQPPTGTSGLAIAALVLGICGFFFVTPIIGLILGLVALSRIKRSGQRGRGMAVSGIVLSGLWIALFATLITVAVVTSPDPARRDASGNVVGKGAVSVFGLHPKDCFTVPAGLIGSTDSSAKTFTVVPCTTPHDSEALGSFTATESSFPGTDALRTESTSQCFKTLSGYLPDLQSLPSGSLVQYVFPNKQAWDLGEHRVTCFVQFPAATMTQSVHRDASSYTTDQLRFINAVHPLIDAIDQLNVTSRTAELTVLQQRASDIAAAEQSFVTALAAAPWPADVQPAVDTLVTKHRDSARLWSQAASAADVTSFTDDAGQANGLFDMTDMKAARTALGLTAIAVG